MKKTGRRALFLYGFVGVFLVGVVILFATLTENSHIWAMNRANRHLYSEGVLVTAGDIKSADDKVLVTTKDGKRVYNENRALRMATLHTVGDNAGYIASGVQTAFKDELTGYTLLDGVYNLKKYGRGNDIKLTLNSKVCETAYRAMGNHKGTVGVMNYKTGEIICVVSTPTYDINNKPKDIYGDTTGKYDGVYMNRFFSGLYTPGSTFKIITAACAIENIPDIFERTFECKGKVQIGEGYVTCMGVHEKITFEEALNNSCNVVFSLLADELSKEKLTLTAERLGFNKDMPLINGKIKCSKSKISLENAKPLDIGWAGIGQYTTLINPCHMLTIVSSIANGGVAQKPYLISEITTPEGKRNYTATPSKIGNYFTQETAVKLGNMLRSNVKNKYSDTYFPKMEFCGKTGTAEISDDKDKKPNALFVGYSRNQQMPYAIIVIVEDSSSGLSSAVPIASKVMKTIKAEYA